MQDIKRIITRAQSLLKDESRLTLDIQHFGDAQVSVRNYNIDIQDRLHAVSQITQGKKEGKDIAQDSVTVYVESVLSTLRCKEQRARDERDHVQADIKGLEPVILFLQKNTSKKTCPICLDAEIDTYLTPCGHTLCNACSTHTHSLCFMCKQAVQSCNKLYYST